MIRFVKDLLWCNFCRFFGQALLPVTTRFCLFMSHALHEARGNISSNNSGGGGGGGGAASSSSPSATPKELQFHCTPEETIPPEKAPIDWECPCLDGKIKLNNIFYFFFIIVPFVNLRILLTFYLILQY